MNVVVVCSNVFKSTIKHGGGDFIFRSRFMHLVTFVMYH